MAERNVIQRAFDDFGRSAGFEKKSGSWYRTSDEVISVSNLQKSQYGPAYYFNQAFWLRQVAEERYPKEQFCHIRTRLGMLFPESEADIEVLLDLERPLADQERAKRLAALLTGKLVPLIEEAATISGLQALLSRGAIPTYTVTGVGRRELGLA